MNAATALLIGVLAVLSASASSPGPGETAEAEEEIMELGAFSVSLAVKDLAASRTFYEKLGFRVVAGDAGQGWLILRNQSGTIGLFHGMFERNIMTFNPGWDRNGEPVPEFDDVREIQRRLKERGLELSTEADAGSSGPASLMLTDPDGNPILIDQHVPRPER
jgi:catechol 2,3-dioxygenase-like lactoylglutathione lyase family enzyme